MEERGRGRRPNEKPEGPSGRGERNESERPEWQRRVERVRTDEKSPLIPSAITPEDLDISARVQLKTLTAENAEMTARHLAMVSLLIDDDPALAHKHALAASRRAGRLAIAHETLGLTAYAVGDFTLALRELLTHRRLSASNEQLPLIVDSERGMERPQRALEAVVGVDRTTLPVGIRINLAIALSGARLDMGEAKLALQELEIPELSPKRVHEQSPALFRAYAECLRELGRNGDEWDLLAERAETAIATQDGELFEIFEEISIPTSEEFDATMKPEKKEYKPRREGEREERPRREGGYSRPGGDSARPSRPADDRDERPKRSFGVRPPRDSDSRPSRPKPMGDRTDRPARSYEDRPRREAGYSRPGNDSSRPFRPAADRPRDGRPAREGDRDDRPRRDSDSRPSRPRPQGDRTDRPARSYEDRPRREGDSDRRSRPAGDRPRDDRPRREGDRPDRPARNYEDRPRRDSDSRPSRPKPQGDRTDRPARSYGDRPRREGGYSRPAGDSARPSRPAGDRDERPKRSFEDRPRRDSDPRPSRPKPQADRTNRPARNSEDRPRREAGYSRPGSDSARPSRPAGDRPKDERPRRDGDARPARSSDQRPSRPNGSKPVERKRFDRGDSKPRRPNGSAD